MSEVPVSLSRPADGRIMCDMSRVDLRCTGDTDLVFARCYSVTSPSVRTTVHRQLRVWLR